MLNWSRHLYTGENIRPRLGQVIGDLNNDRPVFGVWLITLPLGDHNQLEIQNATYLIQPSLRKLLPEIVGIAAGYDEALEIVTDLVEKAMASLGRPDVRAYLKTAEK